MPFHWRRALWAAVLLAAASASAPGNYTDWLANSSRIVLSVAVHPPKFHLLRAFLSQVQHCQAAASTLFVLAVVDSEGEAQLFQQQVRERTPHVTPDIYAPVVAYTPKEVFQQGARITSAWKKWFGIAHLMDLGAAPPQYGLMVDAELGLYSPSDCGPDSHWRNFSARIQEHEKNKLWFTSRVPTKTGTWPRSHESEVRILNSTVQWVTQGRLADCRSAECGLLNQTLNEVMNTWWNDVPYVNLRVAGEIFQALSSREPMSGKVPVPRGRWQTQMRSFMPSQFEHMAYQQWCVLHEGFRYRDVSEYTGYTSDCCPYSEAHRQGARLGELFPMWIALRTYVEVLHAEIPAFSSEAPPYLLFHTDRR